MLASLLGFLLWNDPLTTALDWIRHNDAQTLKEQIEICEVPAPTFRETQRAKLMARKFRALGLERVETDTQGNILGWRRGEIADAVVVAAHLDISFAQGVNTKIRREGNRIYAPGIGDDSRGLAALLAIVGSMRHANIRTRHSILFVANVGEEGLGDLSGVKYLFQKSPHRSRLKAFISIDGLGSRRVVNAGTGVKRYRVSIRGPGGHSYANFGRTNPATALGNILAAIGNFEMPTSPRTTYNVGKVGGGTVVNAIPEEVWFEMDMRSESAGELDKLELRFLETVRQGVDQENKRRATGNLRLSVETKMVGNRPWGRTPESDALVAASVRAVRTAGEQPVLGFSSTDSNLPMSLGIPAVTLGGGGAGDNWHSLEEWYEPVEGWKGPQVVLRTILFWDWRE